MSESPASEVNRIRRAKIVCTLGPSTHTSNQIEKLVLGGMDVARLNFSHGEHSFHCEVYENVRAAAQKHGKNVAIMQDLQGPKIRLGKIEKPGGVQVKSGDTLLLYPEGEKQERPKGVTEVFPVVAEVAGPISKAVSPGGRVLFDDGKVISRVKAVRPPYLEVEVEVGGTLTSNKGINLPGAALDISCCTEKDYRDLKLGLELGVDAVALSFVRSHEDIIDLRTKIKTLSKKEPLVVSKIEREEAIEGFGNILDVSDAILIARGDMAVEIGADRVPVVQKRLIADCHELGVPVITATQMLESMISNPMPTRAEASDVANAIFDGTDAVMLSGETAAGCYPVEALEIMERIIWEAEENAASFQYRDALRPMPGKVVESITYSAAKIAQHVDATAVACITHSGTAARTVAKYRPSTRIIAIMDKEESLRRLAFSWGVEGVTIPEILQTDDLFDTVERVLKEGSYARDGDSVVVTAGIPSLRRGTTNMIKVHVVGAAHERGGRRL